MDIPYGFDCYAFSEHEVKYYESNIIRARSAGIVPHRSDLTASKAHQGFVDPASGKDLAGYLRFTRKYEDYTRDQLYALGREGRFNMSELHKQVFCGIKIQVGIGVVANFLQKGLQYRRPNKGRSELINGTWNGIVSGLTVDRDAYNSYDVAFGNFLAYDEEFPYIKFGPFLAIESKLVMLTGSSRRVEASSFGTNIQSEIWMLILSLMLVLSLLASFRVHWQHTKHRAFESAIRQLIAKQQQQQQPTADDTASWRSSGRQPGEKSVSQLIPNFFFIYFTMLLNKPSLEFDEFIWPKHNEAAQQQQQQHHHHHHHRHQQLAATNHPSMGHEATSDGHQVYKLLEGNESLRKHYLEMVAIGSKRRRKPLPSSIRVVSYLWSAACFVMASIYSGEMLAVILLHTDQNIDTISQLINSKPQIEPVIRQDDFTYNLMLRSLDSNMLILHNMTKIIPRPEVYTRRFIESVSQRKQALLGDDELIETIYEIYHKHFPLYRSKITYLQYPISIMYRKDLNASMERALRRGMVQVFEMGLIHRWYQAQKETYVQFYDTYEKKEEQDKDKDLAALTMASEQKYRPLSMHHFESFFRLMLLCILFAFLVLGLEVAHNRVCNKIQPVDSD